MSEVEYKHTEDMGEISGFGGDYEAACQQMLHQGVVWLNEHPEAKESLEGRTLNGIYGLFISNNDVTQELEDAVCKDIPGGGPTGAMVQAVMTRLFYISARGWEEYCAACRKSENESTN